MVRIINQNLLAIIAGHGVSYPTPSNLNYFWGFGSISGCLLVWQVLSGVLLAMHYAPEVSLAFNSIEHIMRDVPNGWLIRYCHSGGASMFFIFVYIHISRGIYFRSYRKIHLWYSGLAIFLLMMATAFLGYVLPWGQMSLWGATVITNLFGAIPVIGKDLVIWLWGGFSVDNPTLKRFFVLHFILPLVLIALSGSHLVLLHEHGSTNPLGVCSKIDLVRFYPKFVTKDIFGFITFVGFLVFFTVFWYPNELGHPDNYIRADALITPKHIVPEWYFLPFYAILRSIPDKLGGVFAMALAIIILFFLPYFGKFTCKSSKFLKTSQFFFWCFVFNLIFLGWLGACVVEYPYILFSQLATIFYFSYFLLFLPFLSFIENSCVLK
jgi:ubiquinol-cytochrome c reductase cytochrome b subunit